MTRYERVPLLFPLPPSIIEIKPRQLVLFSPSSTTPRPVDSRYLHLNFNCRERQSANRTPKLTDTRRPISIFSPVSRSIEHVGCAPFDPTTCQNPSSPQAQSNFSPGRRYDPVHDSSMWRTHASSSNVPLRPPYSPPDVQQWPPAFVPGTNWQGWSSSGRPNFGDFNGRAPTFGDVQRDITAAFTDSALPQLPPFPEQPSGARQYLNAPWSYGNRFVSALRPSLLPAEQDTRPTGAASQLGTAGTTRLPSTSAVESLAEIFSHVPNGMAINRNSYPHPNRRHMSDPERSDGRFETQVRQQPHTLESESESTSDRENSSVFRLALTRHARDELYADMGNLDERAIAAMRGQISASKRLPTEEALGSLETLNAEDLKGKAKSCDICYNEFGISNPEGEVEQPTRLPKCKHIFGDKCIKKWFEDSNSCPYCRDQLPSQLVGKRASVDANIRAVQRERLRLIAQSQQRVRQDVPPHVGFSPEDTAINSRRAPTFSDVPVANPHFRGTHDAYEYEQLMSRHLDTWGAHSGAVGNRHAQGESTTERRRPGRGRLGNGRSGHLASRPTSTGSARSSIQSFSFQGPPRPYATATPQLHPTTARRPLAVYRPDSANARAPQTPHSQASHNHSSPTSSSPEEASPPVAVGSGPAAAPRHVGGSPTASGVGRRASDTQAGRYQAASWDEEMRAYEANTPTNARTPPPVVAGNIPAREGGQRNSGAENPPEAANVQIPPLFRW
ncbi:uncharacterized protein L3040_006464 [Drepanopeziza brunnea f. sp. 'multigermtubi']|uniref:uncharacterized protein n=1 Tax=Drepanopeziza brunnea f. sp. 'multigermtubi' TaxID=698441 RepID=UPI00238826D1|nr:hypothetical protein L3040_006464 [Drepanopeziza brunnea f. sp. 'multigermtubi']